MATRPAIGGQAEMISEHEEQHEELVGQLRRAGFEVIPSPQYEALVAVPYWLLKLRSLGYISSGHGRAIADEALSIVRAVGIEIKADSERDERLRQIALTSHETKEGK
jgi:hypothetical protein